MYKLFFLLCCAVIIALLISVYAGINQQKRDIDFATDSISKRNCSGAATAAVDNLCFLDDKPLSMSTERYNLINSNGDDIAIIDISSYGVRKSSVVFRYARYLSDVSQPVSDIIQECR